MSDERQRAGSDSDAERRGRRRVRVALGCNWGWDEEVSKSGKVTSLSLDGCFLQTTVYAERGKLLHIHLWLPTGEWLKLQGAILYAMERVGFGVGFLARDEKQQTQLLAVLDHFEANPPVKR